MLLLLQTFLEPHFLNNTQRSVTSSWIYSMSWNLLSFKVCFNFEKTKSHWMKLLVNRVCSSPTNMSFPLHPPPPWSARERTLVQPESCHNESTNCWEISSPLLSKKPAWLFGFAWTKKIVPPLPVLIGSVLLRMIVPFGIFHIFLALFVTLRSFLSL